MFFIAKNLILKNKFLSFIMAIQLVFFLILSNCIIGVYNQVYWAQNAMHTFDSVTFIYTKLEFNKNVDDYIDTEYLKSIGTIIEPNCSQYDSENEGYFTYYKNTLELFHKYLKYGKWFGETDNIDSDAIETVIIGDKKLIGSYIYKEINSVKYKFYVSGSFGEDFFYISNHFSSNGESAKIIKRFLSGNDKIGFFFCHDNCPDFVYNDPFMFCFINDNYDLTMEHLKDFIISHMTTENIYKGDKEQIDLFNALTMPLIISFSVLGIITLISMLSLNIKKQLPDFKQYFKFGMNKKHIFLSGTIYFLLVMLFIIIAFLVSMIFIKKIITDFFSGEVIFNFYNILFTLLFSVVLYGIIELIFFISIRQKDISEE